MALQETRAATSPRTILQAAGLVKVTLAATTTNETVLAGDCIGIKYETNEWVLSARATVDQPLLVVLDPGISGDTITCAMMAIVEVTTTKTNVGTIGEKVCYDDNGAYKGVTGGYPDVGFVASVASDSLSAQIFVCPCIPHLTIPRS